MVGAGLALTSLPSPSKRHLQSRFDPPQQSDLDKNLWQYTHQQLPAASELDSLQGSFLKGPSRDPSSLQTTHFGAAGRPGWKWGAYIRDLHHCDSEEQAQQRGAPCQSGPQHWSPSDDESWGSWAMHTWQMGSEMTAKYLGAWDHWLMPSNPGSWRRPRPGMAGQTGDLALRGMLQQRLVCPGPSWPLLL